MADWLKIEVTTVDKPEVHLIAAKLNIDPDAVVGKLIRVWAWFDQHTISGNDSRVTAALLNRVACHEAFCEAMVSVGWLNDFGGSMSLPSFDRHNGKTAKNRALSAKRQTAFRHKTPNAVVTKPSLPRREEKIYKEQPLVAAMPLPVWVDEKAWTAWLKIRKARSNTPSSLEAALKKLSSFRDAGHDANDILNTSLANGWQGLFEPKGKPPPRAAAAVACGNCNKKLTGGWSQSPKGRVCEVCHRAYLGGSWPQA